MDLLRIVPLDQGNEVNERFDVYFMMKSPVEELEVGGDRMSHLYNALTLHELNKKSVESLALLQCPVVKNIAEISD